MTYLNQQDIAAWAALPNKIYQLEDIEPLRLIAEAIDERCALVGVEMSRDYHVVPGQWPMESVLNAIHDKIAELLPHFIRMDFDDYREMTGLSAYDPYREMQYSNFPIKWNSIAADRRGSDTDIHPMAMDSENEAVVSAVNDFYRSCKHWIDKMFAVDVTQHTFLSNCYGSTVVFSEEWEGSHTRKVWSSYEVNGELLSGDHSIEEMVARLAGIEINLVSSNWHCDHGWQTIVTYEYWKEMEEYRVNDTRPYQYAAGDFSDQTLVVSYIDHPGLCRCQNPAAIGGRLHMVLCPYRRVERNHDYQIIDDYSTEPAEYGYSDLIVKADREFLETKFGYDYFTGDLEDGSVFKTKTVVTYPGYDPLRDNVDSTTVTTFWNPTGETILTSTVETYPYRDYPSAGSSFRDTKNFYVHDGHYIWDAGTYDRDFGLIGPYKIKDVLLGTNVKNPTWVDLNETTTADVPAGWVYWGYQRATDIRLTIQQKAKCYIDYTAGLKYHV